MNKTYSAKTKKPTIFPEAFGGEKSLTFGMGLPGRQKMAENYRYGFGGHEKIDEVNGAGGGIDMGDRWLDVKLGRTSKQDAKATKYPNISPYTYVMNNPIFFIDPDGRIVRNPYDIRTQEKVYIKVQRAIDIVAKTNKELYEIVNNSPIVYNVTLTGLQTTRESNAPKKSDETGALSALNFNTTTTTTTEFGFTSNDMSARGDLQKVDKNPYSGKGYTAMQLNADVTGMKRVSITEEEANDLVSLDPEQKIQLNKDLSAKSLARTLAHELGHAKFAILNKAKQWFSEKVNGYTIGHEPGNPSGVEAEQAEKDFNKNYKNATKEE